MPWDSDFDVKLYTEQDITMEGHRDEAATMGTVGTVGAICLDKSLYVEPYIIQCEAPQL